MRFIGKQSDKIGDTTKITLGVFGNTQTTDLGSKDISLIIVPGLGLGSSINNFEDGELFATNLTINASKASLGNLAALQSGAYGTLGSSIMGVSAFDVANFAMVEDGFVSIKDGGVDLTAEVTGVLPSANLDADTAHLSTDQTFTGTKTFDETISGSISGSAATVTGAAQTNITSLGTLTALTVDDITINGNTITASADLNIVATGDDIDIDTDNFTIGSATGSKPLFILKATSSGNKPSVLNFIKDKGAAGAANDSIGFIQYTSDNDAQEQITFASTMATVSDATDGAEEGKYFIAIKNTSSTGTQVSFSLTGNGAATDATIGYDTGSVTTIAGTLTMGSTAFVNNSGVIQVATQGTIDHDSLANFVANEHIDWTGSSAGTIHSTNIPTLNQNTTGNAATATNLTASTSTAVGLGTIELGHASDTTIARSAAGTVTIEGNPIQTTNVHHHFLNAGFFLNFPFSRYIPLNGSITEQNTATSSPEYVNFTWPYDGFVKTMWLRSETDMGSTNLKLYKGAAGATVTTELGNVTATVGATATVEFDFTSVTNTYSQGDTMAIKIDPTEDPDGGQNITIELVFDLTT
jgi:hypothetical protein